MNRRTFLALGAGAPAVFGLTEVLAFPPGRQDDARPAWYSEALKRMKETGRCGVALVAPEGPGSLLEFGQALLERIEADDADVREMLFETVFICLTAAHAKALLPGEGNRLLLDPDGKRIAGDAVAIETLDDTRKFVDSFRAFVHGERGERLRDSVATLRKGLSATEREEIEKSIDALDTDAAAPEVATVLVSGKAERIASWLVCARLEAVHAQGRDRLRGLIAAAYAKRASRLPFGTRLPKFRSICGHNTEVEEGEDRPGPPCGMAESSKQGRRFIKVLIK